MNNIFVLLDNYLAHPDNTLREAIKKCSHELSTKAYEEAKTKFPDKKIGADEFMPILMDNIKTIAQEALLTSTRLIVNKKQHSAEDPAYIFMLSLEQKELILQLQNELLAEKHRRPDGLIFAYHGYIERLNNSNFNYCPPQKDQILSQITQLRLNAEKLNKPEHKDAANILLKTYNEISELYKQDDSNNIKKIIWRLKYAQNSPALNKHTDIKKFLTNFLLILSVVGTLCLATTMKNRGSFLYDPDAYSKKQLKDLEKEITPRNTK